MLVLHRAVATPAEALPEPCRSPLYSSTRSSQKPVLTNNIHSSNPEAPWRITRSQLVKLPPSNLVVIANSAGRFRDSLTALCSHATEGVASKMSQGKRQGQYRRQGTSMHSMLSATDCCPRSCCSCCCLLGHRCPPYACIRTA